MAGDVPNVLSEVNDVKVDSNHVDVLKWRPLSLTFVEYPSGDLIGYILAWYSLLPIFILVGFATLIVFRRDLHTMFYLFGILLNEVSNWILKHTIKELRPHQRGRLTTEFGMPSSHAQFMWFFSTYLSFCLFIRFHHNNVWLENAWKYATCIGSILVAFFASYSRVYLEYHSCSQVCWGAGIGVTFGTIWFLLVNVVFTPVFPTLASCALGEFFLIRDTTLIPNTTQISLKKVAIDARSSEIVGHLESVTQKEPNSY
ncbi:Dolichyldiphosphatase 1 [Lamellibrachia satsuma]|nr:Dolichyldiphosphatase 1 [Lamellibrachia satsuma]